MIRRAGIGLLVLLYGITTVNSQAPTVPASQQPHRVYEGDVLKLGGEGRPERTIVVLKITQYPNGESLADLQDKETGAKYSVSGKVLMGMVRQGTISRTRVSDHQPTGQKPSPASARPTKPVPPTKPELPPVPTLKLHPVPERSEPARLNIPPGGFDPLGPLPGLSKNPTNPPVVSLPPASKSKPEPLPLEVNSEPAKIVLPVDPAVNLEHPKLPGLSSPVKPAASATVNRSSEAIEQPAIQQVSAINPVVVPPPPPPLPPPPPVPMQAVPVPMQAAPVAPPAAMLVQKPSEASAAMARPVEELPSLKPIAEYPNTMQPKRVAPELPPITASVPEQTLSGIVIPNLSPISLPPTAAAVERMAQEPVMIEKTSKPLPPSPKVPATPDRPVLVPQTTTVATTTRPERESRPVPSPARPSIAVAPTPAPWPYEDKTRQRREALQVTLTQHRLQKVLNPPPKQLVVAQGGPALNPGDRLTIETAEYLQNLHNSLRPSVREHAATCLAECRYNWRPEVKQLLAKVAVQDPAASVRAHCVKLLSKLGYSEPEYVGVLKILAATDEPIVKNAAAEALLKLQPKS